METVEKEVQDTSCRGSGGVPQINNFPKTGGYRGLIKTISTLSYITKQTYRFNLHKTCQLRKYVLLQKNARKLKSPFST